MLGWWFTAVMDGGAFKGTQDSFFRFTYTNIYPFSELFDWWHDRPVFSDWDKWLFYRDEFWWRDEDEPGLFSDIYGTTEDASSDLLHVLRFFKDKEQTDYMAMRLPMLDLKWKHHNAYFRGDPRVRYPLIILDFISNTILGRSLVIL